MSERPVFQAAIGAGVELAGGLAVALEVEAAGLPVALATAVAVEAPVVAVDLVGLALMRQLIQPPAWSSP